MRPFADHFSTLAAGYASYRPGYPSELFTAIAAASPGRGRVWDCATGSGQAAVGLAAHFDLVLASDASHRQVGAAPFHHRIRYLVALAEAMPLRSASVDAVTVAQALHWLELPVFYGEARRVLRPDGLMVVWTYGNHRVDGGDVDAVVEHFYDHVIGPYWAPERRWVETGYRTMHFPFQAVAMDTPPMVESWTLDRLLGYIGTWSAVARYREAAGRDPLVALAEELQQCWGDPTVPRRIEWPLSVRAGR